MQRFFYLLLLLASLYSTTGFSQTEFRLGIEVRDKYTKRPLVPIISVLAANSEAELKGQMVNDWYVVQVKPTIQYQVFVALEQYKTYRQTHTFETSTTPVNGIYPFIIELESVNPPKTFAVANSENAGHTILIIDKKQRAVVQRAIITVKDNRTGQFIPVKKNPNVGGSWLAELKETEQYNLEVSAPDYETYKETVKIRAGEGLEIPLTRIPKQELKFLAVDAATNKPVAAQFKISDETKESYTGTTNTEGSLFNPTVIVQKQLYSLAVNANGYRKHESKLAVTAELPAGQAPQVIKLSKIDVVLKIKILEEQSALPLTANVRVIDQTDKRPVLNVKGTPNGQAATPLNPDHKYVVEAEAKGFMPYQQALEKSIPILSENSELTIKLAKIGDTYLNLSAVNAATGQRIAATFKITASLTEQTTELKGTASPTPLKHKISEPDIYHIETIAPGYVSLKHDIDAEEMAVGQVFNYQAQLTPDAAKLVAAPIQFFAFKVLDANTRKAIPSLRFKISNLANQKAVPAKIRAADVRAGLQIGQNYLAEIEANGYEKISMRIETAEWIQRGELLTNVALMPIKKSVATRTKPPVNDKIFDNIKAGQSLTIEDNVYFDQSSYILRAEVHNQLNRLAAIMANNPAIHIEIVGHTDNIGDSRLNQILSEQRSKVIANYLVNQGVSEANITHRGEGQTKPIAPNDTEENRQRNRRVQFLVR
jgi:outer membrane protein OmpA-like peptidoglycan-associated protein